MGRGRGVAPARSGPVPPRAPAARVGVGRRLSWRGWKLTIVVELGAKWQAW
jgi:hypothetical protein